jgi:CHAT domain-containing protein/tetratricopeptide (TPR) repeat protein
MLFSKFPRHGLTILAIPLLAVSTLQHGPTQPSLARTVISSRQEADHDRSAAEKAFSEPEQLLKEQRAEASRRAIERFKESLPLWRAAGNSRQEALTLKRIGDVYQLLGEYQTALTFYNQALSLARSIADRQTEAEILNEISYVYLNLGENQRAVKLSNQALRLSEATGNQRAIARAYNNLSEIHYGLGKLQRSLTYAEQALQLWRSIGDSGGQAFALLNSGYVHSDLGQVRQAFDLYNQALSLWEATADRRGEAITLTAIARLYTRIGEIQEALDFFQRAQRLIQPIGDPIWEASGLNGLAYLYESLGESQRALEYYNRALLLFRNAKYPTGEATALGEIGRVYFSLGDNSKALQHHELALSMFKTVGDRRLENIELKEIGRIHEAQGDKPKALGYYRRARLSYRNEKDLRGEAITVNLIGRIYADWGQKQTAMDSFAQALSLSREAEYPLTEAAALNNIARLERDNGNLFAARERTEQALNIIESLREKVNSSNLRASYFASVRQQHEFYVDLLMQLDRKNPTGGFNLAAFEASERVRARSFLELVSAARVGVRDKADPALLERERQLNQQFSETANRRMKLAQTAGTESTEAAKLTKELDELVWQLREMQAQIRAGTIRNLMPTQPLNLKDIQQRVMDDDSVLLEYMLGEERSYVWAVTRTDITSYELPARAQIETAARKFRDLMTVNQPLPNETFPQRQARIREADAQIPEAAAALSDLVIAPVQPKLGTKRLIIVADGALHYIPFLALTVKPRPTDASNPGERIPLLASHEIVYEPSASALAYVRNDGTPRDTPKSIAVFANPVFDANDSRVTNPTSPNSSTDSLSGEVFREVGMSDGKVPALPASRDEAEAIMSFAPWGTGLKALGFEASRATVTSPELAQYRIVHFATHGFVDYERPELSGLVLSLVDRNGQPQEGYFRLHDIYNLKLSADLVVLSACNTALGKEIKGEGLIGLTRGFMYAGAGGVAASLWKVDDEATAALMTRFYEGMFRKGLTPSAAMREAQLWMWQQQRWRAPYFWAAFIIQGRYDQTEIAAAGNSRAQWLVTSAGLFSVCLLAACLVFGRRRSRTL